MTEVFFDFLKSILVSAGIEEIAVYDAHKTNVLKCTPRAVLSFGEDTFVQDVDVVSVSRSENKETLYKKLYDCTTPCEIEITAGTSQEAEALRMAFLSALPTRKVLSNVRIGIKAERVTRKRLANDGQLIGIKDAKEVLQVKITHPVLTSLKRTLITDVNITPNWRNKRG